MAEPIISVEGLGKRYRLRHNSRGGYTTLREALAARARAFFKGGLHDRAQSIEEDFWAIQDVTFDVKRGDVVGIVGRNGAGKSTLLKLLSRITEPTAGRIALRGRVASLLEVGTGFHPELTGRENIFLNGAILGMSKAEIRGKFDEIVDFAEVEKFLDTAVKHYSSGMYVRLAFAVAAHLEPEILIVDEVLAVGDSQFQQKCLGKMQDVAKGAGRTVLFVSHNLAAVEHLCTSAVMLRNGRLVTSGGTADVLECYRRASLSQQPAEASNDRLARPSWAQPIIHETKVTSINDEIRDAFGIGDSIRIHVAFITPATAPLASPVLGVVVKNNLGVPVAAVNMRMTGDVRPSRIANGTIICELDAVPLAPGRYTVDAWLGDGPIDVDAIECAAAFEIEATDYYGSGVPPFGHLGHLVLKPTWAVLEGKNTVRA